MERKQGRRRVVAAVLCLLGALAAPLPAAAEDLCDTPMQGWPRPLTAPPPLCGDSTFTATGIAGFLVTVPDLDPMPRIPRENVTITIEDGTYAFFGINEEVCPILGWDMCMARRAYHAPGWGSATPFALGTERGDLRPGLHEVYIVSDGTVTVELRIEGLSGAMQVEATGVVDARLERLPRNCPTGDDCEHFGFGGLTHVNGEKGWASSLAYARVPSHIGDTPMGNLASSASAVACVYPNNLYPNTSPDPADHPHGCDLAPTGEDLNSGVNFVGRAADVLATGYMHLGESPIAHGEVYAGYTAEQFSPVEEGGHYDAWGMWITQGVDCPSGDFHNCRTGP